MSGNPQFNTSSSTGAASSSSAGGGGGGGDTSNNGNKAVCYGVFILTKHGLDDDSRRIVLVRDDGLLLLEGSSTDDNSQPLYKKSTLPSSTTPPELSDFFRRAELKRHIPLAKIVSLDIRSQGCTIRLGILREHDLVLSDSESGYMSQFLMALDQAVRKAAVFVKGSKALGQVFDAEDMKLARPKDFVSIHSKIERRARLKGTSLGSGGISTQRPFNLYDWNATMMPLPPVIDVAAASSPEVAKCLADHVIIILGHVYLHRPPDLPAPADPADRVKLRVFALSRHQLFLLLPERGEIKYKGSLFGLKKIELVPPAKKLLRQQQQQQQGGGSGDTSSQDGQSRTGTPTSNATTGGGAFPSTNSPGSSSSSYLNPSPAELASLQGVMTSVGDSVAAVLEQEKMILHMEDPQVPKFILSFKRSSSAAPTADVTNSVRTVAASICSLFERQGYLLPMIETGKQQSAQASTATSAGTQQQQTPASTSSTNTSTGTAAPAPPPKVSLTPPLAAAASDNNNNKNDNTTTAPSPSSSKHDLLADPPERKNTNPPTPNTAVQDQHSSPATDANTNTTPSKSSGTFGSQQQSEGNFDTNINTSSSSQFLSPTSAASSSRAPNLSPGNTPRGSFSGPQDGDDQDSATPGSLNTPRAGGGADEGDYVHHDALPQDASPTAIRMRTTAELATSKAIPDFKNVHPSVKEFDNPAVLLARKCMRLTSKLRWETRICIITGQQVILCGEDKSVRRSIALIDVKECILTYHWQGTAITLLIDGAHDCVLRGHKTSPQEHAMTHVAGLITELNPAIKLTRDTSNSKLRLKQVVSAGRNLQKGEDFLSPAAEVKRIKAGLAPSPLQRTLSQMQQADEQNIKNQQRQQLPPGAISESTCVKDYPQPEKDRFTARVRLFYSNFYEEGLKNIDQTVPHTLATSVLSEKQIIAKMCEKYQADPVREEEEAKAKNVFPKYYDPQQQQQQQNGGAELKQESSMARMHKSANDTSSNNNNKNDQQQQQQQPLLVSGAPLIKDMSPAEKERLRKRVKLFYENHHKNGLETFDQNIETVLGSASYTEEFLFSKMYEKYKVDPEVEKKEATDAGCISSTTKTTSTTTTTTSATVAAASSPSSPSAAAAASPSPRRNSNTPQQPRATPIKDMSPFEKMRLRKRVRLFYENHHTDGLNGFDTNIENVLNTATYSEEYLFVRMYDKYSVDAAVENEEATKAGVMGSKVRSRPATPDKRAGGLNQQQQQSKQQQSSSAGAATPTTTNRGESVSGEVNEWLSPEQKKLATTNQQHQQQLQESSSTSSVNDQKQHKLKTTTSLQQQQQAVSTNIIYSQVFADAIDSYIRGTILQCRATIFDAKKQDYSKKLSSSNSNQNIINNIGITGPESLTIRFELKSITPVVGLKSAWSHELSSSSPSSSPPSPTSPSGATTNNNNNAVSGSSLLTKEEVSDDIRMTLWISSLGIVADFPLSFFCRTFLPQIETSSFKTFDKKSGNWNAVAEYSAWKVRTRAMFV